MLYVHSPLYDGLKIEASMSTDREIPYSAKFLRHNIFADWKFLSFAETIFAAKGFS